MSWHVRRRHFSSHASSTRLALASSPSPSPAGRSSDDEVTSGHAVGAGQQDAVVLRYKVFIELSAATNDERCGRRRTDIRDE